MEFHSVRFLNNLKTFQNCFIRSNGAELPLLKKLTDFKSKDPVSLFDHFISNERVKPNLVKRSEMIIFGSFLKLIVFLEAV